MAQFFVEFRGRGAAQQPPVPKTGQMAAEESKRPGCDDKVKAETDTDPPRAEVVSGNQEEARRGDV